MVFLLSLYQMSQSSSRAVLRGPSRPPLPPVWERFPLLEGYYGGIRTLVNESDNAPEYPTSDHGDVVLTEKPRIAKPSSEEKHREKRDTTSTLQPSEIYNPYPDYDSDEYRENHVPVTPCFLDRYKQRSPSQLRAYNGVPQGMPDAVMGSHHVLGIRHDVCFDRFGRYGPYGLGYSRKYGGTGAGTEGDREGADATWSGTDFVDYRKIDWAVAQAICEESNQHRFTPKPKGRNHFFQTMAVGGPDMEPPSHQSGQISKHRQSPTEEFEEENVSKALLPRTVVLIRTWQNYNYDPETILYLRSLVAELSLLSGGEYSIHFLVQVHDTDAQIWADEEVYGRVLNETLPPEFRNMGTLWSEAQMALLYPGLSDSNHRDFNVHSVYRSAWMPFMYFAHEHPEFDYFWNLEMDMRYTGHWYELLTKSSQWAAKQPRKGLWERNSRFYVPSEHGSWEDFSQMVRLQTEHGTAGHTKLWAALANNPDVPSAVREENMPSKLDKPVWGPEPPLDDELEQKHDQHPPTTMSQDNHEWGVGEEADLITFNPLFDPHGTNWVLADDITGYNTTESLPPRRAAITTFSRLSRRLVDVMWHTTVHERRSMATEMFPASVSLHHGLKAVYAPHPALVDRRWPTDYLASVFNGGRHGASGGARLSVFSDERQHNFRGSSWYYDARFAPALWRRWLGYKVDGQGGEQEETGEQGEGRMCLRSVLLHPVKQVDLVYEHEEGDW